MLNKDFREFIESLNSNGVRCLVLGGYALAFHGHPRYTKVLDIWLELSTPNAERTMAALADFGFSGLDLSTEDFMVKGMVVQLGYPQSRIDLLIHLTAWNSRNVGNEELLFIWKGSQFPSSILKTSG